MATAMNRWEQHWSAGPAELAQRFARLGPRGVRPLAERLGLAAGERPQSLGSVENRVFSFTTDRGERRVLKLYRPGRWCAEALREELQLLEELRTAGVPVVQPLAGPEGEALGTWEGMHFVVFVHVPTLATSGPLGEAELRELGRLAARMHLVSARAPAVHRMDLEPRGYGLDNLAYLERGALIPAELRPEYLAVARAIIAASLPRLEGVPFIRVHGDFGVHNLLRSASGWVIADFDDFTLGPAVFDLCRLHIRVTTPWGAPEHDEGARRRATQTFVAGYRELRPLPEQELAAGQALRAMRTIGNDAWKQSRLHDPHFCRVRAVIREHAFWHQRIAWMRAQLARIGGD